MTRHWGVLLDWTVVDFIVLGIAIQQYVSISRDLRRTRALLRETQAAPPEPEADAPRE